MPDKQFYLKQVAPEHKRHKFMKWLDAGLKPLDDVASIISEMDSQFDLDGAIGVQLEITGAIVGRERMLNFEPPLGISPVLEDSIYRILQRAKISINQWDGTIPGMYALWDNLFPELDIVVEDNQDMSMNVYILGDTLLMERELMARGYITPKPEAVRINYKFILPQYNFEETLYTGGAVVGDNQEMHIPDLLPEDLELDTEMYTCTGLYMDNSLEFIATNTAFDGARTNTKIHIATGSMSKKIVFVPTEMR